MLLLALLSGCLPAATDIEGWATILSRAWCDHAVECAANELADPDAWREACEDAAYATWVNEWEAAGCPVDVDDAEACLDAYRTATCTESDISETCAAMSPTAGCE